MNEGSFEKVECYKTDSVMAALLLTTQGPAEAYAILITCIYELNFKFCDQPVSIDDLCEEVTRSLRSVTSIRKAQ